VTTQIFNTAQQKGFIIVTDAEKAIAPVTEQFAHCLGTMIVIDT